MQEKQVEQFISTVVEINHTLAEIFDKGDIMLFPKLNAVVKQMYAIEHESEIAAIQAVGEDCSMIYRNFDMIIAVLRSTEEGVIDSGAQSAINNFLHNIDRACVSIAASFGVV